MSNDRPHLVYLLRGFEEQFGRESEFCDVRIYCAAQSEEVIRCHSVILMSLSPFFKKIFRTHQHHFIGEDVFTVMLPEPISPTEIREFLRVVYGKLTHVDLGGEVVPVPKSLVQALQIRVIEEEDPPTDNDEEIDDENETKIVIDNNSIEEIMKEEESPFQEIIVNEAGEALNPFQVREAPKIIEDFSYEQPVLVKDENDKNSENQLPVQEEDTKSKVVENEEVEEQEQEQDEDDKKLSRKSKGESNKKVRGRKIKSVDRSKLSVKRDASGFVARIGRFVCPEGCGELFKSQFAMDRHVNMRHAVASSYMCEVCGAEKDSSLSLTNHMLIHKEYNCEHCGEVVIGRNIYKRHVESQHMERLKCDQCGKDFRNKIFLNKHVLTIHSKEEDKVQQCSHCDKRFAHPTKLKEHVSYCHPNYDPVKCTECFKEFKTIVSLRRHLENVHRIPTRESPNGLPPLHCDICFKLFKDSSILVRHQNKVHSPDQSTPYTCDHCKKKFPSRDNLEDHIIVVHTGGKPQICHQPECPESFATRPELRYHLYFTHKIKENPLIECGDCGKRFISMSTLSAHQRRLHCTGTEKERKHVCDTCGKRFYRPFELTNHIKVVHLKKMEFVCDIEDCSQAFSSKVYLKNHKARKHGIGTIAGMGDHYCEVCGKKFTYRMNLNLHMRSRHTSDEEKKFKCSYCDRKFILRSMCRTHEKTTHTGTHRFRCGVENCNYHSSAKQSIIHHQARRHGIGVVVKRRATCKVCDKVLGTSNGLKRHMRTFHSDSADKVHKCAYCNKGFREVFNKDEHEMAMHIKAEPYKCVVCGKGYNRAMSLRKHEKRIHQLPSHREQARAGDVRFDNEAVENVIICTTDPDSK